MMSGAHRATSGEFAPFVYVAASGTGSRRYGLRRARNRRELGEQLRRERLVPLRSWQIPGVGSYEGRLGLKDQAEVHQQLAQLLGRGVPLVEALEVTATAVSSKTRPRVDRMRELVASGASFAEACRATGAFDPITVAVYQAAERTGDLSGAAKQLSDSLRRQLRIGEKAVTMMVYPAILLVVTMTVTAFLLTFVVPKIGANLESAGATLPLITRVLISIGAFMRANLLVLGLSLVGIITLLVLARRALRTPLIRVLRKLPLIRQLLAAIESGRFFTVMAAMSRAGVPLADSLTTATNAVIDPIFKRELHRLRTRLIEGGALRSLIADVQSLPPATRRLLVAGERSGDLDSVFDTLSADMAEDVDRRSARLLAAIEPALIITMFLMVGTVVMSIMVPLLGMARQIG